MKKPKINLDGDPCLELLLDVATSNVLERAGIRTVRQLLEKTESQLLCIPQFGRTRLRIVKSALDDFRLRLASSEKAPPSPAPVAISQAEAARQAMVEQQKRRQTIDAFLAASREIQGAAAYMTSTLSAMRRDLEGEPLTVEASEEIARLHVESATFAARAKKAEDEAARLRATLELRDARIRELLGQLSAGGGRS